MKFVQRQIVCRWLAPLNCAAQVEAELAALGASYFKSEGTYVWNGGSAPAARYEFRCGTTPQTVQGAFDRLNAAGVQLVGDYDTHSPFDGWTSLF